MELSAGMQCVSVEHGTLLSVPIYTQAGRVAGSSAEVWRLAANWVTAHPSNVSSHDVTPTNHYSPACNKCITHALISICQL